MMTTTNTTPATVDSFRVAAITAERVILAYLSDWMTSEQHMARDRELAAILLTCSDEEFEAVGEAGIAAGRAWEARRS